MMHLTANTAATAVRPEPAIDGPRSIGTDANIASRLWQHRLLIWRESRFSQWYGESS